ncbi:MAG: HAD-IA family hydrolase [Verrucomicrobia bacterium]|nr:HAD-IA family hydrolase [Verrucomicrobiota bacterium]MBI3868929.1 HAD-IA family hydrolase [Verrucomicrobiota bacterium]
MSSRVRALSFDAGGTLIAPWPSVGQVYADAAAANGFPGLPAPIIEEGFRRAWRSRAGFDYSLNAWRELVLETFSGLCARDVVHGFFPDLYRQFARPEHWRVLPGASSLLSELRSRGFLLAVTSNWDERLRPLLGALGLADRFAVITISMEAGWQKPDRRIFLKTCSDLGVLPDETLHVGDSPGEDVEGAKAAGLKSALFDPSLGGSLASCVEAALG